MILILNILFAILFYFFSDFPFKSEGFAGVGETGFQILVYFMLAGGASAFLEGKEKGIIFIFNENKSIELFSFSLVCILFTKASLFLFPVVFESAKYSLSFEVDVFGILILVPFSLSTYFLISRGNFDLNSHIGISNRADKNIFGSWRKKFYELLYLIIIISGMISMFFTLSPV